MFTEYFFQSAKLRNKYNNSSKSMQLFDERIVMKKKILAFKLFLYLCMPNVPHEEFGQPNI